MEELFVGMDWAPTNASGSSLLPMWQSTPHTAMTRTASERPPVVDE